MIGDKNGRRVGDRPESAVLRSFTVTAMLSRVWVHAIRNALAVVYDECAAVGHVNVLHIAVIDVAADARVHRGAASRGLNRRRGFHLLILVLGDQDHALVVGRDPHDGELSWE